MNDLRFALRSLARSPGFTAVALLSLALGIGANTAVFSLVNEVLLRTLPVRNPDELVLFRTINGAGGQMSLGSDGHSTLVDRATGRWAGSSFSLLMFERFRAHHPGLTEVLAFSPVLNLNLLVDGQPELAPSAQLVSGNYYAGLGVTAALGRTLAPDDDQPSAPPVAVISWRYWNRRFNGDPAVLGKTISVNRIATTIVGVSPQGFAGAMQAGDDPDVSVPLAHYLQFEPDRSYRRQTGYWWVRLMGRLAPDTTAAQARAALEPVFQEAAREGWQAGASREGAARVTPELPTLAVDSGAQGETDTRRRYRTSLHLLLGLASLVLLAACANVANLLLARGTHRRREIAVRLALGASRRRLVGQLLAESLLLASAGAALGVLLAGWCRGLLVALHPFGTEHVVLDLPLDARVLAFTIGAAVATALLFGLLPALRVTRLDLATAFQGGARTIGGGGRARLSQALMILQIALSLVLLVSTGLFVRTLRNLEAVDPGFDRRHLALLQIDAGTAGYQRAQLAALYTRIQRRLEQLPGVRAATFSGYPLLSRVSQGNPVSAPGMPPPAEAGSVLMNNLAPNYFAALSQPVVLGRAFTERDGETAPRVGIINQALAARYFGRENPVGRQLELKGGPRGVVEIVGVVRDASYTELRGGLRPTLYLPTFQQLGGNSMSFIVRTAGEPAALFPAIRAALRDIDAALPVLDLRTLDEQIDRLNAQELLFARLSGLFGALTLVLAGVGLYGLMSYQVRQRTDEIGLRMALGAQPANILGLVLREASVLAGIGAALGLAVSAAAGRLVAAMLYGLSPIDPVTYALGALVLVAVALVAAALPARRAAHVDPLVALRIE